MSNFLKLLKGEIMRLIKYKILQISLIMTVLWIAIIYLIGKENAPTFIPLFIFSDSALMSVLLIGAGLFYEKQENTLKTLMITPSSFMAIIISKVIAAIYLALQSTVIIALFSIIFFDVSVSLFWLIAFTILISLSHSVIGFTFAVFAKDFNELIAQVAFYMIIFAIPTLFFALGVFSDQFEFILMFSPTHASLLMINYAFNTSVRTVLLIIGSAYLIIMTILLFKYIIVPKYPETAVKD